MTTNADIDAGERLRRARGSRGLSQSVLAARAGISRQALSAIESGVYQPGVGVALRLARELGESVENLFGEPGVEEVEARWAGGGPGPARARVALARIGGRMVAVPQPAAALRLAAAAGVVARTEQRQVRVMSLRSREEIEAALVIAGCDPAVVILSEWLARRRAPVTAVALATGSANALVALAEGNAHAAGVHLRDPRSGEYNLLQARRALGRRRIAVVNFARWELGLATASGNPFGIRGFADLMEARIRIVNRENGAGARAALDEAIGAAGGAASRITGYGREVGGHLEVAAAIANGAADAGVTIRVAAESFGLGFVPVREERYDLVMLASEMASPPLAAMLEALNAGRFALELRELCGYDTRETGSVMTPAD